ncbi:MAG: flagellar biosynthesis protein FlhF [Bdellovibrionales bacterium]|nr:flagellar biosynthesis protein FlhF [Bdellovibrionales bacterium]
MQVKKFEAPTMQEAIETIKRELGPEAIILQTKTHKRGFGLMSKSSVEITVAISDRSFQKKQIAEKTLPEPVKKAVEKLPAARQMQIFEKSADAYLERNIKKTQDQVQLTATQQQVVASPTGPVNVTVTARRYADIQDTDRGTIAKKKVSSAAPGTTSVAGQLGDKRPGPTVGKAAVEEEVERLKRMILEMKSAQEENVSRNIDASVTGLESATLKEVFDQLLMNGVDKKLALTLVKRAAFELGDEKAKNPEAVIDQVAQEMMAATDTFTALDGIVERKKDSTGQARSNTAAVIALVGPTGVGKTTTLAKIASLAILKKKLKVGLINLDSYKVAAFDQLATYAKILNVPFRSVSSKEDLQAAVDDFEKLDLVLIDTTGRSQRDPESLKELGELLKVIPNVQTQLVLSSTTRDAELYDMANRFKVFLPQGIIFSKLDESTVFGSILNVCHKTKLPLVYFTTGQRVPEDIEDASRERLVSLVMDL